MTDGDFAAEEYRQQRRAKSWCPVIVVGLLALLVGCFRLAALVLDKACR